MAAIGDPIFPVIEAIRAASLCCDLAPEQSRIERAAEETLDRAWRQLIRTTPTTLAGMLALIEITDEHGYDAADTLELVAEALRGMVGA